MPEEVPGVRAASAARWAAGGDPRGGREERAAMAEGVVLPPESIGGCWRVRWDCCGGARWCCWGGGILGRERAARRRLRSASSAAMSARRERSSRICASAASVAASSSRAAWNLRSESAMTRTMGDDALGFGMGGGARGTRRMPRADSAAWSARPRARPGEPISGARR